MLNKINISNLCIGYENKVVVSNINVNSNMGQFISIIGRNGGGKSTLIKTLTSLTPALEGDIQIDGKKLFELSEKDSAKLISVVLTNKIMIQNITVFDFIAFGRHPYTNWLGFNSANDSTHINDAINLCEIQHLKTKYYAELSDGEKQKVNIARAIAQNTQLIILDEPTAHLDLVNKIEVFKLLKRLVNEHQKTIIISTHQIEMALHLSDSIWMITGKEIICETPTELMENGNIDRLFKETDVIFNQTTKTFTVK